MKISPDEIVFWQYGWFQLNATIAATWGIMLLMVVVSFLVTRNLSTTERISRFQNVLEAIVSYVNQEIENVTQQDPRRFLALIGTLFLFILVANVLSVVPGFIAPTGSLSTTAALAICVFVAVPIYGIRSRGVLGYFKQYAKPTIFMLPFNVLGELSRTLALAVRLFGNVMSGTKIVGIFLALAPVVFPVIMHLLGLLTGVIQAYIFAILALVYIGAAARPKPEQESSDTQTQQGETTHG
jgi:F-type H+-transporting ATPase subunit a